MPLTFPGVVCCWCKHATSPPPGRARRPVLPRRRCNTCLLRSARSLTKRYKPPRQPDSPDGRNTVRLPRPKALAAASVTALSAGVLVAAALPTPASASGPDSTFIVLAPQGQSTARAATRVAAAGGTVVANYNQIGVLVARSTNPAFATAVSGSGVDAVASTTGLGTALDDSTTLEAVDSTVQQATGDP